MGAGDGELARLTDRGVHASRIRRTKQHTGKFPPDSIVERDKEGFNLGTALLVTNADGYEQRIEQDHVYYFTGTGKSKVAELGLVVCIFQDTNEERVQKTGDEFYVNVRAARRAPRAARGDATGGPSRAPPVPTRR